MKIMYEKLLLFICLITNISICAFIDENALNENDIDTVYTHADDKIIVYEQLLQNPPSHLKTTPFRYTTIEATYYKDTDYYGAIQNIYDKEYVLNEDKYKWFRFRTVKKNGEKWFKKLAMLYAKQNPVARAA